MKEKRRNIINLILFLFEQICVLFLFLPLKVAKRSNDDNDKRAKTYSKLKGNIAPSVAINNRLKEQKDDDRDNKAYSICLDSCFL
jgi:hypothetical protein